MLAHLFDAELVYRSEMEPLTRDHIRSVAATLLFESDYERYAWVDSALGNWDGEFDGEAHLARYRAYLVKDEASVVQQ